jgi:uncharacterized protein YdeI (YjbR/CyaY-like superfamily)
MEPTFFRGPEQLRRWFARNHTTKTEIWVGYYKKDSGKPSITWPESVDEALCVGWIDGIRKSIDAQSYKIRFTPRRPRSIWSAVNIKRVAELTKEKRMQPAGLKAFEARKENRSGIYAYEQRRAVLEPPYDAVLKKHPAARAFFEAQPPSYRKTISWYVVSAKKEETRMRRLMQMIELWSRGETGRARLGPKQSE